jgi:antagonist of KipI
MAIRIHKAGIRDTIQDAGRFGFQHWGVNPGGAMDAVAMQVANALVGNAIEEAVIEMHFPAAQLSFEQPVLFALAGADFDAALDGLSVEPHQPVLAKPGSVLKFNGQRSGSRVYLAIRGGFVADSWLNSYSTHLKVGAGGYKGRVLQKNDVINFRAASKMQDGLRAVLPWKANLSELYTTAPFYFIPGAEYDHLDQESKTHFQNAPFSIDVNSDRMGYRLKGPALHSTVSKELISTAVTRGTVQLLPDGQLIILMADHQTTGGYPRIGHVISAHLPSVSRLQAGEEIRFMPTDIASAEKLLLGQQRNLQQLQNACTFRLQECFSDRDT